MNFPKEIQTIIDGLEYKENNVGMTSARIFVFDDYVLKVEETGIESNNERKVLTYLQGKIPVPELIAFAQANGFNYLLMSRLRGYMAFEDPILYDPENTVRLLASAIQKLWEVDTQKFESSYDLNFKLEYVRSRFNEGLIVEADFDMSITDGLRDAKSIIEFLYENKPDEDLVFTHGDYCLPNVFFNSNELAGFIDLGRACVSDRYQDISLCMRSLKYNLRERYEDKFFELFLKELNIKLDRRKIKYYLLLDELF